MTKHKSVLLLSDLISVRSTRVQERLTLDEVPQEDRSHIVRLSQGVERIIQDAQDNDGIVNKEDVKEVAKSVGILPHQVVNSIKQALSYRGAYPDASIQQALSPVRHKQHEDPSGELTDDLHQTSNTATPRKRIIKKRRHIMNITDHNEREQRISYAQKIAELLEAQRKHSSGYYGMLDNASIELKQTKQWLNKRMNHLASYRAEYGHEPDYHDANAFMELPRGRQKGRNVSSDVQEAIEQSFLNTDWQSFNRDGTTSRIDTPINTKMVHSIMQAAFTNAPSYSTVWRVGKDLEQQHPSLFLGLREDIGKTRENLPSITFKSRGVWEYVLFDIRPLPLAVNYQGIVCTVRAIIIMDHHSGYQPVWHLLPAKRIEINEADEEEVVGQDYTCQKIRELVAIALLRVNARPHIAYPDKGPQFIESALGKYMDFLVAPGEDKTILINRQGYRPRGGGAIENALKQLNAFVKFRPTYINEKDYRRSLKKNKKIKVPDYWDVVPDFDIFMNSMNTEQVNGKPSRWEQFRTLLWKGLTLPSMENLSIFALASSIESRRPKAEGFSVKSKFYVPARKDINLYAALADENTRASKDPGYEILVCIVDIADNIFVWFSLDKGETWERTIPKEQDGIAGQTHTTLLKKVEAMQEQKGRESAIFMKTLLSDRDNPIVLNALHATPIFETLEDAKQHVQAIVESPSFQPMPMLSGDLIRSDETGSTSDQDNSQSTKKKGGARKRGAQTDHRNTNPIFLAEEQHSDDLDDFLSALGYKPADEEE